MKKGFTLLELIIVIVIIGILATLGFTQYTNLVESMRLAEAKTTLGIMRKLATEYWFKNGDMTNIQNSDLAVNQTCSSTGYYCYWVDNQTSTHINLAAWRCGGSANRCPGSGKSPNPPMGYTYFETYFPGTGQDTWQCSCDGGGSCAGCQGF